MQTFIISPSFKESAEILDDRRLNKQILEAYSIYNIIINGITKGGYVNHPIVRLWKGYPEALALYYNECLHQWKDVRGRNHSYGMIDIDRSKGIIIPNWSQDSRLHSSHRANLLRKDFEFYSKYGWAENTMEYWKMPYWWGEFGYGKVPDGKKMRTEKLNTDKLRIKNLETDEIRDVKIFKKKIFKIRMPKE